MTSSKSVSIASSSSRRGGAAPCRYCRPAAAAAAGDDVYVDCSVYSLRQSSSTAVEDVQTYRDDNDDNSTRTRRTLTPPNARGEWTRPVTMTSSCSAAAILDFGVDDSGGGALFAETECFRCGHHHHHHHHHTQQQQQRDDQPLHQPRRKSCVKHDVIDLNCQQPTDDSAITRTKAY